MSCYIPRRYIIVFFAFLAAIIDKFIRTTLSVAIIPISEENGWTKATNGLVLSSFFWGYIIPQAFGGAMARRFGFRFTLGFSLASGCIFVVVFPFTTSILPLAVTMQICCGLCHSFLYPSLYQMVPIWFPKFEKSFALGLVNSGGICGIILCWSLSSEIISIFGWHSLFFISGGLGIVWFIPYLLFTMDGPETSEVSCINPLDPKEVEYILSNQDQVNPKLGGIPWKRLLTARPVLTLIFAQFVGNWVFYIWMSWLPSYYVAKFNVTLKETGLYSLIPMPFFLVTILTSSYFSDYLYRKNYLSLIAIRRISQSLFFLFSAISLLILSFVENLSLLPTIIAVVFSFSSLGLSSAGKDANFIDLTPKYASSIFGVANTVGTLPGIIGVYLTGFILEVTNNNWSVIFIITAVLCVLATLLWLLFVQTSPIDFDDDGEEEPLLPREKKKKERFEIVEN